MWGFGAACLHFFPVIRLSFALGRDQLRHLVSSLQVCFLPPSHMTLDLSRLRPDTLHTSICQQWRAITLLEMQRTCLCAIDWGVQSRKGNVGVTAMTKRDAHSVCSFFESLLVFPSGISSMPAVRRLMSALGNMSGPCMYSSCVRTSCCSGACSQDISVRYFILILCRLFDRMTQSCGFTEGWKPEQASPV